jgi:hypothetical protein
LAQIAKALASLEGDLEAQLATTNGLIAKMVPLSGDLQVIQDLNTECEKANIEDNEYFFHD